MSLTDYQKLLSQAGFAAFCSKPYGLELMFILDNAASTLQDNGIDDTYDAILYNKPRRAAFSSFLQMLEFKKHLIKMPSERKASKSVLRLSEEVAEAFTTFRLH